ncbi:diacylglycerol kinase family protein [Adlercreutzia sp. R21]|uniref:diacylglycerol kinase family protein n=1 Tax=Adlercreutzia wanghongyangiae TaxID=3111451 RepID=UPI002DB9300A|nr:diacylglycerol kinase family protein [Adlercreutzia sp. R21]MEC4184084.1 diacylglycerol kinase family protein [Adlercreutzia sp. R21]
MAVDGEQRPPASDASRGVSCGCSDHFVRRAADSRACGAGRFPLACAFRCAARGIGYAFSSQRNLKIQLVIAAAAVVAGFALGISRAEWLAIVLAIVVVAVAEVVNTAVESVVDLASPQWHELARAAKDAGAGAVLIASAGSVVVGLMVFLPHLVALLAG